MAVVVIVVEVLTVTVGKHNVWTLATELHGASLHVALNSHHTHLLSYLCRPRECYLVHVHVPRKGRTRCRTVPGNNIHHTRGEPGLHTLNIFLKHQPQLIN